MKATNILTTVAGLSLATLVNAGPVAPAPMEPAPEPEPMITGEVALNYASTYEFRGVDFGDDLIDATLALELAATDKLTLSAGAWYADLWNGGYNELNLFAGLEYDFGFINAGGGYTWYKFPETGGDANELGAYLSTDDVIGSEVAEMTFALAGYYDFETEGWYFDLGTTLGFALTDMLGLEFGAGITYNESYYIAGNGFNHAYGSVSLPVTLRENVTLTPYFRGTLAMDAIEDFQDDIGLGGVSLAVSF